MTVIAWDFRKTDPNEVESDPINDEFFSSEISQNDVSSLVRESIQNSLDAKRTDVHGPVHVRFHVGSVPTSEVLPIFMQGLTDHIQASLGSGHMPPAESECRYLVVEDFNTVGLLGDVRASSSEAKKFPSQNGYRYFAWKFGDSSKAEGKRGKWGVGKVVFPKLSRAKTYFAFSIREHRGELDGIVFGQSLLRYHALGGIEFCPNGWWGRTDPDSLRQIPHVASDLHDFHEVWSISRKPEQQGLSVVIPFVSEEVTSNTLINAVATDYFVALRDGSLEVQVTDNNGVDVLLNRDNLLKVLNELAGASQTEPLFEIIELCKALGDLESGKLPVVEVGHAAGNKWANIAPLPEAELAMARERVANGHTVVFDVMTLVPESVTRPSDVFNSFEVIMMPKSGMTSSRFYREGILISNANPNRVSGFVALVRIKPGPLADLLGEAEGPAHLDWSDSRERFKDKYPNGKLAKATLIWVRTAAAQLARLLDLDNESRDLHSLAHMFPISRPTGAKRTPTSPAEPTKPIPPASPKFVKIWSVKGGFQIKQGDYGPDIVGKVIRVQIAYALRRGNPFKRWDSNDFDLGQCLVDDSVSGLTLDIHENVALLQVTDENFAAAFRNFDDLRDLAIDARLIGDADAR